MAITGSNEISEYEHVYSPPDGWRNPTPNWWSKDETGVWNNGWLAGEMLANWQHDVCDTALFGSVVPKYPLTRTTLQSHLWWCFVVCGLPRTFCLCLFG